MLENLRNMEPLPPEEARGIEKKLRMGILAAAVCVALIVVWMFITKRQIGKLYFAVVVLFLGCNWILSDVAPVFLARALAGRSDEQVSAYLKAAGLGLLANVGLGWFLAAMSNGSIYGAIVYFIGITGARKQREIYYGTAEQEESSPAPEEPESIDPALLPSAADRLEREAEPGAEAEAPEATPVTEAEPGATEEAPASEAAQEAQASEPEMAEAEERDGSV